MTEAREIVDAYEKLHDAFLETVTVEWEEGEARLLLSVDEGAHVTIAAHRLRKLLLSREEPWGPSAWVNTMSGPREIDSLQVLQIQMQSGDQLEIVAEQFELLPAGEAKP